LLKHTHLQQILELYKQYGKDVTEIQYQIKENIAEQETYKAKPKDQAGVEWMNEIDVADSDLEQQRMSETDLAKLRIDSIENEWQRKRELADWEYQQQIKTYENYENFEQIKTELDKQYATSRKDIAIQEAQSKLEIMSNNLNSIKALFGEHTAAYKILTIFNTLIDTYQAAIAAYKSTAEIPIIGPALAPFAATSATLFGMSQVANIEKTQIPAYEKGGFGIVGEKGLEVIAPMQDYAHGQSELVKTTLIALENTLLEKRYSPIVANNNMSEFKSLMEEQFRRINDWQNKFEFSLHGEDLHTAVRRVNTRITESEF